MSWSEEEEVVVEEEEEEGETVALSSGGRSLDWDLEMMGIVLVRVSIVRMGIAGVGVEEAEEVDG